VAGFVCGILETIRRERPILEGLSIGHAGYTVEVPIWIDRGVGDLNRDANKGRTHEPDQLIPR
jgi:hypothetical protein